MSAVGTQYANSEDRKIDRKAESSLSLLRSVPLPAGGGEGRKMRGLVTAVHRASCLCPTLPKPGVEQEGQRASQIKPVAAARRSDRAGHKSNALYCGDRGSVHVTNQSSSVSGMAGETNHGDPISSAACPSVRREKIKSWAVVEPDIKKTEREIK